MKADAQSSAEKEALELAIEWLRLLREHLTPEGSKAIPYRADILISAYDKRHEYPERFRDLIVGTLVKAHRDADDADIFNLCSLAAELIERGEPLPGYLRDFIVKFLRRDPIFKPSSKRGRKRGDLASRDVFIDAVIAHIVKTWRFAATRNEAAGRPSAASIVREGLEKGADIRLTEKAINKIWHSYRKRSRTTQSS